jgi:hypothetical protein
MPHALMNEPPVFVLMSVSRFLSSMPASHLNHSIVMLPDVVVCMIVMRLPDTVYCMLLLGVSASLIPSDEKIRADVFVGRSMDPRLVAL